MNEQNKNQPQPPQQQQQPVQPPVDHRHVIYAEQTRPTGHLFDLEGNVGELLKGLAKFRAQIKQPTLDASNPFLNSSYLSLKGLITAIDEALKGTGLSFDQIIADNGQMAAVQTIITHESGGILITKPLTLRPNKADPQGIGSATTYARRYQLQALFGIAGEKDDDGNAASTPQGNQGRDYPVRPQSPQQNQSNNNYRRGQYNNGQNYQGGQR
ncbi:ERF family protein [Limosilactobacillus fermentum]|uniref:ERF family protein n=1 Tax=Limosilactobacillus fermentum TaxID=1613 RepID=UPI0021A36010|nr:ERF family protein [Limosilactobacillus fermentum]MCT2869765.1 single-stranded DNA-binding protein [Limosilactobacillus fermentum]